MLIIHYYSQGSTNNALKYNSAVIIHNCIWIITVMWVLLWVFQ